MEEAVVGSVLSDRLVLQREIARGGMGVVFEAQHPRLHSSVAVKLLTRETLGDVLIRERLLREAEVLAMVNDPGVVRVLDCAEDERHGPYMVMEMLRGRSLDGILAARHSLPIAETVRLVRAIADSLVEVHARGIVHRDIKPSNLFVVREGRDEVVKLLDFGIALLPESSPPRHKITRPGAICGTPEYMAPEQLFSSDQIDARADVFSLAAVVYECLSGKVPFGSDLAQRAAMHSRGVGAPMLNVINPAISLSVARVIDKALSVLPESRFETTAHFAEALLGVAGVAMGPLHLLSPAMNVRAEAPPHLNDTQIGVDPTELVIDLVQRRRAPRAPYLTPVRVLLDGTNENADGRSQDISESGLQLVLQRPLAIGERVTLRFALPLAGTLVAARGVVRWCRSNRGHSHAVGVEFEHPLEAGADFVRRYVAWFGDNHAS